MRQTFKADAPFALEAMEDIAAMMAFRLANPTPSREQQRAAIVGCIERVAAVIEARERQDLEGAVAAAKAFEDWRYRCHDLLDAQLFTAVHQLPRGDRPLETRDGFLYAVVLRRLDRAPWAYVREVHDRLVSYRPRMRIRSQWRANQVNMAAMGQLEKLFRGHFGDDWRPTVWEGASRAVGVPPRADFVVAIGHLLKAVGHTGNALSWARQYASHRKP